MSVKYVQDHGIKQDLLAVMEKVKAASVFFADDANRAHLLDRSSKKEGASSSHKHKKVEPKGHKVADAQLQQR